MPKVAVMSPEIPLQDRPMVAEPEMLRPPEQAFGVGQGANVGEATQRMGAAVQNTGDVVFQRMMEQREREMAQQNFDVQTQAQTAIQNVLKNPELDDNNMPKGILNRTLNQAKGATAAYDQQAIQLKQQFMSQVSSPVQQQEMNKTLSTMLLNGREQVVSHEADQTQKAFDNSFQTNMQTTTANAAGIQDPAMLQKYISTAQDSAAPGWKHSGMSPADTEAAKSGYAAQIVQSAITSSIERDPQQAQTLFDSSKSMLTPEAAAKMQNVIDEKKTFQVTQGVTDWAKTNARQADGYINMAPVEEHIKALGLPPKQEYTALQDVRRNVWIDSQEVSKQFETNMRQTTLDMLDNKMTGSEAQRLFTTGQLSRQDFEAVNRRLGVPEVGAERSFMISDPQAFNDIRQAQLTGSKSPGEIQRMIAGTPGITREDAKYLMTMNNENPPTARDKYIESQANSLRDFGSRYFAETGLFGQQTNQDKTSKESQALVQNYYSAVDKAKAQGEDIDKIRDSVLKTALNDKFPGISKLDKMPDVVIDVKGRVTRLLSPDEHSGLKPKYRITSTGADDKDDQ